MYIGNLHSRLCIGYITFLGRPAHNTIIAVSGAVRDEFVRDRALLERRFPQLAGSSLAKEIMQPAPWRVRRGDHRQPPWEPEYGWAVCEL